MMNNQNKCIQQKITMASPQNMICWSIKHSFYILIRGNCLPPITTTKKLWINMGTSYEVNKYCHNMIMNSLRIDFIVPWNIMLFMWADQPPVTKKLTNCQPRTSLNIYFTGYNPVCMLFDMHYKSQLSQQWLLGPIWCQGISNHYDDIGQSIPIRNVM